jgi:hypothetical protein
MPANRGISTLPLFSAFQEIYSGCCTVAAQVQEEQGQGPVQRLITLPVRLFLLYGQPILLTNQDLTRLLANSFATTSGFVRCTLEAPWPPQLPPLLLLGVGPHEVRLHLAPPPPGSCRQSSSRWFRSVSLWPGPASLRGRLASSYPLSSSPSPRGGSYLTTLSLGVTAPW